MLNEEEMKLIRSMVRKVMTFERESIEKTKVTREEGDD